MSGWRQWDSGRRWLLLGGLGITLVAVGWALVSGFGWTYALWFGWIGPIMIAFAFLDPKRPPGSAD